MEFIPQLTVNDVQSTPISHERFFQDIDRVNRVMTEAADLDSMLGQAVKEIRDIFASDRAWLLYPCDPEAPGWRVPVEATGPQFPGAFAEGKMNPVDPISAQVFRILLNTTEAVAFDISDPDTQYTSGLERFSIKSQLAIAVRPRVGQPWVMGLHQCSYERKWNEYERKLLQGIAQRLEGQVGTLTLLRRMADEIAERKRAQEQLSFLAHYDPLTGLPNRLLFNDRLTHAINRTDRTSQKLALLFLDLDRFKNVNDSLGHPSGDTLLKEAASRIERILRKDDTFARLGGDEFIVLVEDIQDERDATRLAEDIRSELSRSFMIEDRELNLTVSIGISLYPRDGKDVATLIKNSDAAMYQAKDQGRNRYNFYNPNLTVAAYERLELESALRQALERKQFTLHYQPQISLATGKVAGVEALLRWMRPKTGLVPPAKFIQFAEETGLIIPIGEWVLREACTQMQRWLCAGYPLGQLGLNISGRQLLSEGFSEKVADMLADTGLDPGRLELEITERTIMVNPSQVLKMLHKLKTLGVSIAIDDMGLGYSSLNYLSKMPVNKLKIDSSFVSEIKKDNGGPIIASAIVSLGKSLQLRVVSEGVETREQHTLLRSLGCDEGQGYLYSQPLDISEFDEYLRGSFRKFQHYDLSKGPGVVR